MKIYLKKGHGYLKRSVVDMDIRGRLRICRPQGGGEERITIELCDMAAGVTFADVSVDLAEFARCLTGSSAECEIETRQLDLVGTTREVMREIVRWPAFGAGCHGGDSRRRLEAEAAIARHERHGWKGRVEDALNHHNRAPNHDLSDEDDERLCAYWVTFTRNVKQEKP